MSARRDLICMALSAFSVPLYLFTPSPCKLLPPPQCMARGLGERDKEAEKTYKSFYKGGLGSKEAEHKEKDAKHLCNDPGSGAWKLVRQEMR